MLCQIIVEQVYTRVYLFVLVCVGYSFDRNGSPENNLSVLNIVVLEMDDCVQVFINPNRL